MSAFGCGATITVSYPSGHSYKERKTWCGSTSYYGGVNQCEECIKRTGPIPDAEEDEGDMEWYERVTRDE